MFKAYRVRKKMLRSPGDRQLVLEVLWYKEEPDPDAEYTPPDLIDQVPTGVVEQEHVTPDLVDRLVAERAAVHNEDPDEDLSLSPEVSTRHARHGGGRVAEVTERELARRQRRGQGRG